LKEERPDLPIICDPSHITGRRDLLLEVSQKAMDLNFEGLMIETHPDPSEAWSDAAQQVTSEGLNEILSQLVLRSTEVSEDIEGSMQELRTKISILDDRLFEILGARMELSEDVGQLKRENNITILQQEHWQQVIASRIEHRGDFRLTQQFVRQFMDAIHQESIRHQTKVMNTEKKK
jgi:chorismate mutase